ncbi:hypothetical protein V6N13_055561 [Hibiscus sabdariffa]|uniref:Uncharacterized protein n=1 Tax=Hibiscus sabdariffa TaxID=183260 RepID=A0ABR2BLU0_9ROSI
MATIEVTKQRVRQPGNLKTQQPSVDHVKSLRYNVGLSGWCCDDENDESSRSYGCLVKMVKIRRINSIVESHEWWHRGVRGLAVDGKCQIDFRFSSLMTLYLCRVV